MSYTYLLDLYDVIEERTQEASAGIEAGGQGERTAEFQQGRHEILEQLKEFLSENYNSKLPRRIRKNFS